MSKNYEALHHIRDRMTDYDPKLSNAVQRLFNIEDQCRQCQGCVIDSVIIALLFKKFGIETELHLGEMCADGIQDAYHCWLSLNGQIIDFGIYGNSNYNPYYRGERFKNPFVLEETGDVKYADGSTEESWLTDLSGKSVLEYVKHCPDNRVCKLFLKSLELRENEENQKLVYSLAEGMYFPTVKRIDVSPSGRRGIDE